MPAETTMAATQPETPSAAQSPSVMERLRAAAGRWEALLLGLIVVTMFAGQGLSS